MGKVITVQDIKAASHRTGQIKKAEGEESHCVTCFKVFTLSWMGRGNPIRVSVSLKEGKKDEKYKLGEKM